MRLISTTITVRTRGVCTQGAKAQQHLLLSDVMPPKGEERRFCSGHRTFH